MTQLHVFSARSHTLRLTGLLLLGAALLLSVVGSVPVQAQQSTFEEAKQKYQFAEYDTATQLFQKVADDQGTPVELRRDALRYLGRSYIAQDRKQKARAAIKRFVGTTPPPDAMNPDVEPPALMRLYYQVRKARSGGYAVAGQQSLQTLAVMDFNNNAIANRGQYEGLRKGLSSLMINSLTGGVDLQVIERERIDWLLKELELQKQKDKVDQSTAVRTGKLLGANAVVFGSFIATENQMSITARVVKVETGEVLFGDQVRGKPDAFFSLIQNLSEKVTQSINVEMSEADVGPEQTKSLDAMMAYSDGLTLLEQGKYGAAQRKFQQALDHDDGFAKARKKIRSLRPMLASTRTPDDDSSSR